MSVCPWPRENFIPPLLSFLSVARYHIHPATLPFLFLPFFMSFLVWVEGGSRRLGTTNGGYHFLHILEFEDMSLMSILNYLGLVLMFAHFRSHLGHVWHDLAMYSIFSQTWQSIWGHEDLEEKEKFQYADTMAMSPGNGQACSIYP